MIVVFGSINIDLIGHAPTLMRPGETVLGSTLDFAPGGKGANQALAAARAGAEVRMVGCVGTDDFATRALALLREGGVDLSGVRQMDRHTGTALIIVDAAGENMITVLPGANSRLNATALEAAGIGAGDWLLLQLETPIEATLAAARLAHENGAKTVLNLAPFMEFDLTLLADIDVLVVNETELSGVLGLLDAPALDEAASVAWKPLGWQAVAFSEIEKFPSAVLAHHYPDVPNLGDFTKINTTTLGRVDILCGGTPCQAFSVWGSSWIASVESTTQWKETPSDPPPLWVKRRCISALAPTFRLAVS